MGDRLNTGTFATTLSPQSLVRLLVPGKSCAPFYYAHTDPSRVGAYVASVVLGPLL